MPKRKLEEIEDPQLTGHKRKIQEEVKPIKKPRCIPLDKLVAHYKGNVSRNETARKVFHFYT